MPMMVGGANVVHRHVLGCTWFPVVKFKGIGLLLTMGVALCQLLVKHNHRENCVIITLMLYFSNLVLEKAYHS